MNQFEMIYLEELIFPNHNYRKFAKIWSFQFVEQEAFHFNEE